MSVRTGPFAGLTPLGYQKISAPSTATGVTVPTISAPNPRPDVVVIYAETQDVRWRADGTNPTATDGFPIFAGGAPLVYTGPIDKLKLIQTAVNATVHVGFFYSA